MAGNEFGHLMEGIYPDAAERDRRSVITVGGGRECGTNGSDVTGKLVSLFYAEKLPGITQVLGLNSGSKGRVEAAGVEGHTALDLLTNPAEAAALSLLMTTSQSTRRVLRGYLSDVRLHDESRSHLESVGGIDFVLDDIHMLEPEKLLAMMIEKAKARIDKQR